MLDIRLRRALLSVISSACHDRPTPDIDPDWLIDEIPRPQPDAEVGGVGDPHLKAVQAWSERTPAADPFFSRYTERYRRCPQFRSVRAPWFRFGRELYARRVADGEGLAAVALEVATFELQHIHELSTICHAISEYRDRLPDFLIVVDRYDPDRLLWVGPTIDLAVQCCGYIVERIEAHRLMTGFDGWHRLVPADGILTRAGTACGPNVPTTVFHLTDRVSRHVRSVGRRLRNNGPTRTDRVSVHVRVNGPRFQDAARANLALSRWVGQAHASIEPRLIRWAESAKILVPHLPEVGRVRELSAELDGRRRSLGDGFPHSVIDLAHEVFHPDAGMTRAVVPALPTPVEASGKAATQADPVGDDRPQEKKGKKGKNVKAQMLVLMGQEDKTVYDWSKQQWATVLECSTGSLDKNLWKQIMTYRAVRAAEAISRTALLNGGAKGKARRMSS